MSVSILRGMAAAILAGFCLLAAAPADAAVLRDGSKSDLHRPQGAYTAIARLGGSLEMRQVRLGKAQHTRRVYDYQPQLAYRADGKGWRHSGRAGRHYRNDGSVVIIVREALEGAARANAAGTNEPRLEQACDPGEYCVVRLGPFINSPKIIRLNTTGQRIEAQN
jgi:dihydroorotase-like cyclic amidohydrolase